VAALGSLLAGVVGYGGCGGHWVREISFKVVGERPGRADWWRHKLEKVTGW
jgi:hypothetical protein